MVLFGIAQINLQHSKAATAYLCRTLAEVQTKIYLIQEPYFHKGIKGLDLRWGRVVSGNGDSRSRTCLYASNDVDLVPLPQFCNTDIATALVTVDRGSRKLSFICCSLYLPYDGCPNPPVVDDLLSFCRRENFPVLIGMDANAHHVAWGSSNTNKRGESVMELICSNNLFVLNNGNDPTFVTATREEVIDVTVCSMDLVPEISSWNVWNKESMSDHRYIRFNMGTHCVRPKCSRNPRSTDWDLYRHNLACALSHWGIQSLDIQGLEAAASLLTSAIVRSYESACPLNLTSCGKMPRGLSPGLQRLRRRVRRLWLSLIHI